jgi:hypothetical protein
MVIPWGRWIGIALLGVALIAGCRMLMPSDKARIDRQIRQMAALASFTPQKGNIKFVADLERLRSQFTQDAEIVLVELPDSVPVGRFTPDQIQQMATAARRYVGSLSIKFHDTAVQIESSASAIAQFTASAQAGDSRGQFDVQEFEVVLVKIEGSWRIKQLRALPVMGGRL